jgi:hypothetical protein
MSTWLNQSKFVVHAAKGRAIERQTLFDCGKGGEGLLIENVGALIGAGLTIRTTRTP